MNRSHEAIARIAYTRRWLLLAALGCPAALAPLATTGCLALQTPEYRHDVYTLADDALAGRGLGTEGLRKAGDYIAERFAELALVPAGDNGTFFQHFQATVRRERTHDSRLAIGPIGLEAREDTDFVPLPFSSTDEFSGPLMFAGYGISAPEHDYDDYAGADPRGKVLLVFRYEPKADDPQAPFGGSTYSTHALYSTKITLARRLGAVAMLVVNPPDGSEDEFMPFDTGRVAEEYGLPVLQITREFAGRLLSEAGLPSLESLYEQLRPGNGPRTQPLGRLVARGRAGIRRVRTDARNVVAMLPGRGPQRDEFVVIGAHYDHLGNVPLSLPRTEQERNDNSPRIHNGADDNASGTAGLLALARYFAEHPPRNRSLLFVAFSGEESGTLGSEHFVQNSPVPLDRIVAMLNMDMIGRLRNNKLIIFGAGTAEEFPPLLREAARAAGLTIDMRPGGVGPSDHIHFYAAGIPVLHFFTGSHDDYHRPEDDPDKINYDGAIRVLEAVRFVATRVAERSDRLTFKHVPQPQFSRTRLKVRMGIMPSYADDDLPGMRITGVVPGGPAEKAGLQPNDRILFIGADEVNNIYEYMAALTRYEPGDVVQIEISRAGRRLSIPITLEATRR